LVKKAVTDYDNFLFTFSAPPGWTATCS